jgi:hypothetical protein
LVAAVAFTVAGVGMLTSVLIRAPKPSLIGVALIAAGLPVYWWTARRRSAA